MTQPSSDYLLRTDFQTSLETASYLSNKSAPQETPYIHKYRAIEMLKSLPLGPYSFIPFTHLGDIYADVDQTSDSIRSYQKALEVFSKSSERKDFPIDRYYIVLLQIYNMLGLSYVNIEENQEGIGMLAKAMNIYEGCQDIQYQSVYHNRTQRKEGAVFAYYYQGGINTKELESGHTLTLFYLAQAYAKLGFKDKAATYCGQTIRRQYNSQSYEIKDFSLNLISLADYYRNNHFYAQAQYLLMVGLKVLPESRKKRLRASFHMAMGDNLKELLDYSCISVRNKQNLQPESDSIISRNFLEFEGIGIVFPKLTLGRTLQECKSLFRRANTQYKKALETYVLDGYVTQHIEMLHSQSKLYKSLCLIEDSAERRISMAERRKDLLYPILKELNPKAYQNTWEKILVELAQIMNQIFDARCSLYFPSKGQFPSESKVNLMNEAGLKAIQYYSQIDKTLQELKDVDKNEAYYQSIVNAKFSIAKAYSKLMKSDHKQRVCYLKKSLDSYKDLQKFISYVRQNTTLKNHFQKEEQLTDQMVEMLPTKIDRVNNGINQL